MSAPRQPPPPASGVQLMRSTQEDEEAPEQWARKRAKPQREQSYSKRDNRREGEDGDLVVEDLETFDLEASNDPSSHAKDPHGDNKEARAPWDRAENQQAALDALDDGTASDEQRRFLIEEIRRQVPDVAYMKQVAAGARTVLTLIIPGNGPLGVKTLNDDLVGYQINNAMIAPRRNEVVKDAFLREGLADAGFAVIEQTYKSTTVTSPLPPQQLGVALQDVLRAIDGGVPAVYRDALHSGLGHWEAERDRTQEGTEAYEEAARRVAKIKAAIARVTTAGFKLEFQFGLAAIEHGAGVKPPSYAAALAARMQSSQAALMSRNPDQPATPNTAIGDPRGQIYHRSVFLRFCEEGEALRQKVIDSGNTLTHHGHAYRVFPGAQTKLANRDVLRDVRKGKVAERDLDEHERPTLELFKRYFRHVNAFDNIREFTSRDVKHVGDQIRRAQDLIDSLEGTRDEPIDVRAVTGALHTNPGMGEVIPKAETASQAVFYNAERERTNRIIVSCDIRDMGVDLVQHYEEAMHQVGHDHEKPDLVAQQAADPMDDFRRAAIQRVEARYRDLVGEAIEMARRRGDVALVHELRAESKPSLLMGGDEITLSLHEGMRPYMGRLAAALMDPLRPRARVAISTTGSEPTRAVDDHILAQQRADPAHSVLKNFEAEQRDLELTADEIAAPGRKRRADVLVNDLGLSLLYAESEGKGIVLRRNDTNEVVDVAGLRGRIDEVKDRLRDLKNPHAD
jgi:hypothetical protein